MAVGRMAEALQQDKTSIDTSAEGSAALLAARLIAFLILSCSCSIYMHTYVASFVGSVAVHKTACRSRPAKTHIICGES